MITCDLDNIKELSNKNIKSVPVETMLVYATVESFIGNGHNRLEAGNVYVLTINRSCIVAYRGNIESGLLSKSVFDAYIKHPHVEKKYWKNIRVVIDPAYSIFIRIPEPFAIELRDKLFDGKYYNDPEKNLINTVCDMCNEHEDILILMNYEIDESISKTDNVISPIDNVLISIFQDFPQAWKDAKRFKALLMDYIPTDKARRNLLCISVEEHIPNDICSYSEITNIEKSSFKKRLVKASGCEESFAAEIVLLWIDAIHKNP